MSKSVVLITGALTTGEKEDGLAACLVAISPTQCLSGFLKGHNRYVPNFFTLRRRYNHS
jgi:hypothetical protein